MFQGYKIAVTGATSGIGLASVKKFLQEGATVIAIGRSLDEVKKLGDKCIPYYCDVTDAAQIDKACDFIEETFGGELDTFLNAAGLGVGASIKDITPEYFEYGINLLLRAPILFGKRLYPLLLKAPKKNPSIVNIASSAGKTVAPDNFLYNMAKTGHILYTRQQAAGFIGVRSNAICPGFIDTPIFTRPGTDLPVDQVPGLYAMVSQITPMHRVAQPEEVAELVAFLASEDAMYINGADVLIDGGILGMVSG